MSMDMEEATQLLASLKALRILFLGEAGNTGLVEEIKHLTEELVEAKNVIEKTSISSTTITKEIMLRLANKVANEATVSALQYEQSKIYELVSQSLSEIADKSAEKCVEKIIVSSRGNKNTRLLEEHNFKLSSKNKQLKYWLIAGWSLAALSATVCVFLLLTK